MKSVFKIFFLWVAILMQNAANAQVTISGPQCVTNNTVYMYNISGNFDSTHTWGLCITGGSIDGTSVTCISGRRERYIKVTWTSANVASMQLTSASGTASLKVSITTQLSGGTIDSSVVFQGIDSVTTPATIACSLPLGGGCNPSYQYQWQRSADNLVWTDIAGANSQTLGFSKPLNQSTYFRRKVKTTASDAYAVSNTAAIFINH